MTIPDLLDARQIERDKHRWRTYVEVNAIIAAGNRAGAAWRDRHMPPKTLVRRGRRHKREVDRR